MSNFLQNLRLGFRRLKNSPGFTAVALVTLALGIGANSAIFSIVNAVLLRPLPYHDPQRLVLLNEQMPQFARLSVSYLNYRDWREQSHSFEGMGAVRNSMVTLTGIAEAERVPTQYVTANMFELLGLRPELGRTFTAAEDAAGAPAVAVISHDIWQRHFSSAADVIGKAMTLDNQSYSIVGVMPAKTEILQQTPDVFLPFEPWAHTLPDDRSWHPGILPIARLKSAVSLQQARAEMAVIAERLAKQYPENNTNVKALVDPMQDQIVQNVRPALLVLLGAVGVVLLIACANVANLLLVRATGRRREIAVCVALGARRRDIFQQLIAESLVLSCLGGAIGLFLAWIAVPVFLRLAGNTLPRTSGIGIDGWVLAVTALVALGAGILFGLAPAPQAWRVDVREALSEGSRAGSAASVLRTRTVLVVAETALAVLLLSGAGLLFKSFQRLSQVSPGFSPDHLFLATIVRSPVAYKDANVRLSFYDRLFERVSALPGVRAAGGISTVPVTGSGSALYFNIAGHPPRTPQEYVLANYRVASGGYLKALQLPLLAGRWIDDRDRENAPAVVVVNSTFAKTFFPNQSPMGQHIQVGATPDSTVPWMEIVGVIADTKQSLASESAAEMYAPYRQADKVLPVSLMAVVVRTSGDPLALANSVRSIVRELDPNQPITNVQTMEQNISQSVAAPRFRTVLLAVFAGIALLLAAVGIFGVMAYSIAQRTREIGLRMALGASRAQVLRLVVGSGVKLTFIGIAIGLVGSVALTRYLASMLFNVRPNDPVTLLGVVSALVVVSLCACYLPARRATRIDPVVALREQ